MLRSAPQASPRRRGPAAIRDQRDTAAVGAIRLDRARRQADAVPPDASWRRGWAWPPISILVFCLLRYIQPSLFCALAFPWSAARTISAALARSSVAPRARANSSIV